MTADNCPDGRLAARHDEPLASVGRDDATEPVTAVPTSAEHRLVGVLQALGENAEDIADRLRFGGWRGLPHDVHACPIALYLRTVMADVTDAVVSTDQATVHTTDGAEVVVDLSRPVAAFVLAFDLGAYPGLVDTVSDDNGDVIDDLDL